MTREITVPSGNTYICTSPTARLVVDLVRWVSLMNDKGETMEMRTLATHQYGIVEDDIIDSCLCDAEKAKLDLTPLDLPQLVTALVRPEVSKKKSKV